MSKTKNNTTNSQSLYKYSFENSPTPTWIEDFTELYDFLSKLKKRRIKNIKAYFDKHPDVVRECAKKIVVVDANKAAINLHKTKDKKQLLTFIDDAFTERSYKIFKKELIAVYNGKNFYEAEAEVKTLDGEIIDVIITFTFQFKKNKIHTNVTAIVTLVDITNQKRYKNIINASSAVAFIWSTKPGYPLVFVSENVKSMFGYSAEDFISGKIHFQKIVHPEDFKQIRKEVRTYSLNKIIKNYIHTPYRIITKKGEIKWVEDRTSLRRNSNGEITAYESIILDITKRVLESEKSKKAEQIINTSPSVAFVWQNKKGWPVEFVSENVSNLFGYTADEFLKGKTPSYYKLIHKEDIKRVTNEVRSNSANKKTGFWEHKPYRIITKDGKIKWVDDKTYTNRDKNGKIISYQGLILDITKRINAQNKLKDEENKFRNLVDKSLVGVYIIQDGKFPYVNPKLAEIFGYKQNEIINKKNVNQLVAPKNRKTVTDNIKKRLKDKAKAINYSFKGLKKDGTVLDVEVFGTGIKYNNKPAVIGTLLDITKKKKAEQSLKESEEKFRSLSEYTNSGIFIVRGKHFIYVNPALEKISGYSLEEAKKMRFWEIVHPDHREMIKKRGFARQKGKKIPQRYEFKIITKNGETKWVDFSATKIDFMGSPSILGTAYDITEIKLAEKKLFENKKNLEQIYNTTGDVLFQIKVLPKNCFVFTDVNKAFIRKTGLTKEQIIGKDFREVIPTSSQTLVLNNYKKAINTKQIVLWEEVSKYPTGILTGIVTIAPAFDENDNCTHLIGSVHDITEIKKANQKLRELFIKNEKILSTMLDGFILTDIKGNIVDVNKPYCKIMGYTKEELLTKNIGEVEGYLSPDEIKERIKRITELGHDRFETFHIDKSGGKVDFDASISLMELENEIYVAAFVRDIRKRKKYEDEILNNERELRNLATHLQSIREEERKLLAREIHDELGQILTAAKIDLRLLEKTSSKNAKEIDAIASLIQEGINATRGILNQLRPELLQELGLIESVKELISKLRETVKLNITFRSEVQSLKLNLNKSLPLYRIIQESLNNVIKHSKSKTASVSLKVKENNLIIKIKDNGIGFNPKVIKTDSFGLLGMRERLIPLNGKLNIESKRAKGTTVTVSVPIEIN